MFLFTDAHDSGGPVLAQISRRGGRAAISRCVALIAGLSILSALTAVHLWVVYRDKMPVSWLEAVLSGCATWFPWIVLAPGVFALARRYTFEPGRYATSLLVHLFAAMGFGVLHGVIRSMLSPLVDFSERITAERIIVVQWLFTFMSYWVLMSVYQAWHNYSRYRERELCSSRLESQLAQAQLEVLRMQLHPHFLFNTLHAVSTLLHRDPDAADEMLSQLSDLLRMTLENFGLQEVSLREELDFVRRYVDIQQMRFQDRLHIKVDVPPETLDARVPNQALQPLIENAIHHGLEGRIGSGTIEIKARARDAILQLTVRDDGVGLRPNWQDMLQEGIGLSNTRARLKQLYGPLATLDLSNHASGGTVVTMIVPQPQPLAVPVLQGDAA